MKIKIFQDEEFNYSLFSIYHYTDRLNIIYVLYMKIICENFQKNLQKNNVYIA
jgi:hypothetical protein